MRRDRVTETRDAAVLPNPKVRSRGCRCSQVIVRKTSGAAGGLRFIRERRFLAAHETGGGVRQPGLPGLGRRVSVCRQLFDGLLRVPIRVPFRKFSCANLVRGTAKICQNRQEKTV